MTRRDQRRFRGARALLLASATLLVMSAAVGAAPRAGSELSQSRAISVSQFTPSTEECAFLRLVNTLHAASRLKPLVFSKALGSSAEHHGADMASRIYLSHTLSDGTTWSQNIHNHSYNYNTYRGENIASGKATASATFTQWKNSPAHNSNKLSAPFTATGIGMVSNTRATYKHYWPTIFGGYQDTAVLC